ncbi:hypothetical protein AHAS_Ahas07G0142500 [Arachis hypogaea]
MPISTRWSSEIKTEIKQSMIRVTSKSKHMILDAKMIPLFKMFAGGPIGFGKQWYVPHLLAVIDWFLPTS